MADVPGGRWSLPHHLEVESRHRSAAMRAAGPSLPIADQQARHTARWAATWEWAARDPDDRRPRVRGGGRMPGPVVAPLQSLPPRAVLRLGQLVRRLADGAIGRVVGADGRRPIVVWRGASRGVAVDVDFGGGAVGVAPYRRHPGEEDAAAWRVASLALVGEAAEAAAAALDGVV